MGSNTLSSILFRGRRLQGYLVGLHQTTRLAVSVLNYSCLTQSLAGKLSAQAVGPKNGRSLVERSKPDKKKENVVAMMDMKRQIPGAWHFVLFRGATILGEIYAAVLQHYFSYCIKDHLCEAIG